MFGRIRWRIALVFAALTLLCIGGLSVYLSHLFRDDYVDSLRMQLADQAWLIGHSALPYLTNGQTDGLDELANRLGERVEARVTIIDRSGLVLGDSEEDPATMENHADRPEVVQAISGGIGSSIRYSATLGYDMMYVAVPVEVGGEVVAITRASLSMSAIDSSLSHINRNIIFGALVAAAFAVLLAFQVSKAITRPVEKLTQASKRLAEGDFSQDIRVTSRDEVGDLARAFNRMSARIKEMVGLVTAERDKMAAIVSNMADGIIVVDGSSRITMMNHAAETILGISSDSAQGNTFIEAVRDYELDGVVQSCLGSGEQQTGMVETRPGIRALAVIATPLRGESGCLLLMHDLTEMRRLQTVRQDFVSNVSHELRTPVASLKALAETLRDGAIQDPSVARDFLDKISIEVDRLAQMVQELADLCRIESGESPLEMRPVDVPPTVERVSDRLKAQADRTGLRLETEVGSDLPRVMADAGRLEQILVNLVHNAIKFTPPGGRISISAEVRGRDMVLSVTDTGVGIPADELPRIFERFYKADKARAGGGTGLGLAIAKHIVEAHGGRIWADSVEGKGSTFSFTLPLSSYPPSTPQQT
ncbi:MAG: PAS domain-containing sensor histidine kinase [Chloroflexi bacterium]|nr:MAG: PAS domain-containing sensor histidine kinase [Chloroflexota bacterium]